MRRQPRHHEHAGGHHRRGVDQRGNRRRTLHRIGQPGVQRHLRRLAHRPHEEEQADHGQRRRPVIGLAEHAQGDRLASGDGLGIGEDRVEIDRGEQPEHAKNAEGEAEIADTVDDERLDRRRVGGGAVIPEADQKIGGEADAFPAEEHLQKIVGSHQHQHGEGEQRQIGEEARRVRVMRHVADRVDVDERRHGVDDDQHDDGQRVDAERPVGDERAGMHPGQHGDGEGFSMTERHVEEGDPGEDSRDHQQPGGHELGGERALRLGMVGVIVADAVRLVVSDWDRRGMMRDRRGMVVLAGMAAERIGLVRFRADRRLAAAVAGSRAEQRDQPGDDRAEKRQEDNGRIHRLSPSSCSRLRPRWSRGCGRRRRGWQARSPPRPRPPSAPGARRSAR